LEIGLELGIGAESLDGVELTCELAVFVEAVDLLVALEADGEIAERLHGGDAGGMGGGRGVDEGPGTAGARARIAGLGFFGQEGLQTGLFGLAEFATTGHGNEINGKALLFTRKEGLKSASQRRGENWVDGPGGDCQHPCTTS
jgi:hypothetical protein